MFFDLLLYSSIAYNFVFGTVKSYNGSARANPPKNGAVGREMGFKINGLDTRDPSPLTEGEIYYLLTLDHYFLLNFIFRGSPGPVEFFSLQIKRGVFSNVRTYQLWKIMSLSSSRKAFYFWIIVVQDTSSLKSTTPRLQMSKILHDIPFLVLSNLSIDNKNGAGRSVFSPSVGLPFVGNHV